jgi:ATP-dependent DNA ligase
MFEPQLALHMYKEEAKKKNTLGADSYMVFPKYDGWYGSILLIPNETSQHVILTRQGRNIPSVQWLAEKIDDLNQDCRYHGRLIFEILVEGVTEFSELNGLLNRSKGDCAELRAYVRVHDFIPYSFPDTNAINRYRLVEEIVTKFNDPKVKLAPLMLMSSNPRRWMECAKHVWSKGGEGVILKRALAPYSEGKRNADILKIKLEDTFDLLVVNVSVGQGKYSHTTGALLCVSKDGTVHNISGMSDAARDNWWHNKQEIIGKVVEVRAMCKLSNGSLREPRFKAVRHDKSEADID